MTALNLNWLDTSISQKTDVDKSDLREALQTLGSEMTTVENSLFDKASLSHNHSIDQIVDLSTDLADRVRLEDGAAIRPRLGAPRFALGNANISAGVLTLDCTDGFDFIVNLGEVGENVTSIVFENLGNVVGTRVASTIFFRQGSFARTVAYPASWLWPGGTSTAIGTANKATAIRLESVDGGETWLVLSVQVYGADSAPDPVSTLSGDLAYGGRFYGCDVGCESTLANRAIRYSSSTGHVEIVAATIPIYKTGNLTHIRQNNRINESGQTGYGDGDCAAYLEIRKAKADGTPDMSSGGLLGRTADYDPALVGRHPKIAFQASVPVTAGVDVCILWRNDTQDSSKYYSANFLGNDKPLTPRSGPALGNRRVYRSLNSGSSWTEMKRGSDAEFGRGLYRVFYEFFYSDGIVHGTPYRFANGLDAATYWPLIDGTNNWARQKFKMRDSVDFVAKGVWVRCFSEDDAPTLAVRLTQGDGTLIEEVAVPAANITKMTSSTESLFSKIHGNPRGNPNAATDDEIKWFFVPFTANRTLTAATSYQLQLKAGSGSKIRIGGALNATRSDSTGNYGAIDCFVGAEADTKAQYTTNNGSTWSDVVASSGTSFSYDLPVLFEAA